MAPARSRTTRQAPARTAAPRTSAPAAPRPAAGEVDPAFTRAILKIALELRKPGAESYEAVVEATIRRMRLDAVAFRHFLGDDGARNMSLLLSAARRFGA